MKVAHVETGRHFYGGPQQVIWLIRGLVRKGVESTLVCPPGSAIDAVAREAGIPVVSIACSGEADLGFAFRLHRFLRRKRPDLLHCHSRRGADFPGGWAALSSGTPAVVTRRVDSTESRAAAAIRYKPFRKVAAISENVAEILTRSGVDPGKLAVIRSAVDTDAVVRGADRAVLRREFGIDEDAYAIAVVAQLIERKGHRLLFDTLPELLTTHPRIKVVCFGAGEDEGKIRAQVAGLDLSGAVQFAGFRGDLDQYLSAFDLLVHPAEQEGLGVAMLKAAAASLPVVGFDVAGAAEAVQHMKTGILVPRGDTAELQKAIGALVDSPEMGSALGKAGHCRMQEEFALDAMVADYLALYRVVLND